MAFSNGLLHIDMLLLADQQELIYISSVRTLGVVWTTFRKRLRQRERGRRDSGKFLRAAWLDDDKCIYTYIIITISCYCLIIIRVLLASDLTDKMKRSFFQAAVESILLYGCTPWTLTKRLEKKLDGNYTRMLWAILNKSWRQHPTRQQLYGHLSPITKTIQVRRTRHAGHCWRSRDELISDVLLWTPTYGREKAGRPARTYIQQLCEIRDVALKTCQRGWTIGRSGERGSGISVLAAWHDDNDISI